MNQKINNSANCIKIKFIIDSSSKEAAEKLSSKNFKKSVQKDTEFLSAKIIKKF